ncbi:MAG: hypothetical protein K2W96_18010 [Gemmataceae bacterium]|nr:hypothetical protein [Gemmataceae bacterium]
MTAMLAAVLLAAPEVLVVPFDVPEAMHDGVKLEVARWPGLLAKSGGFTTKAEGARYRLTGKVRAEDEGRKLVIRAELRDSKGVRLWDASYELTEFTKKVAFMDETRGKIEAAVRARIKK